MVNPLAIKGNGLSREFECASSDIIREVIYAWSPVDANILVYAHRGDSPWYGKDFPDLVCENPLLG